MPIGFPRLPAGMALLCAAVASLALAGPAGAEPLDEAAFLRRFDAFDPQVAVLAARVERARAAVATAGVRPNPTLSVDRDDAFAGGRGEPVNRVSLQVPFDASGRRALQVQAAQAGMRAVELDNAHERHLQRIDALAGYRDAAYLGQRAAVLAAGLAGVRATVQTLRKRVVGGHTAGYDLQRLEVELADWQALVAEAEADSDLAAAGLALRIGAATPIEAQAVALPTVPTGTLVPPSARSDLLAAAADIEQADQEAAAARRRRWPGVALTGGVQTQARADQTAVGYVLGVAITLPWLDRGEAESLAAAARHREADARRRALAVQVPAAVQRTTLDLHRRVALARQREQTWLPQVERLARQIEVAWREGERPAFELVEVWRTAREGRLHLLDLQHAARRAELDLWRASGRLPWEVAP